jgi:hypothetical protein
MGRSRAGAGEVDFFPAEVESLREAMAVTVEEGAKRVAMVSSAPLSTREEAQFLLINQPLKALG